MSLPVTRVVAQFYDQSGAAAGLLDVKAVLTRAERDGGVVVPREYRATTDESGLLLIDLWPNARGSNASQYRVTAKNADGALLFDGRATVPESESAVDLIDILTDPLPSKDAALLAVEAAQAARDKAEQWADEDVDVVVEDGAYSAKHQAVKAAASASTAATAAGAASTSADAAAGSASAASDSADAAAASAGTASTASSTAVAAQGASSASASAAADSASAASDSADIAMAAAASGNILFYITKASANDALSGLDEGQIVDVIQDESRSGLYTRYQVVSGAFVFTRLIGGDTLYGPSSEQQDVLPLEGVLRLQAMYDAERIRRLAGCPAGVHVGVRDGVTPGLSDEEALVTQAKVNLTDEAAVIALASSGTGTWADPYIIQNLDISNPSGSSYYGFIWSDSSAAYHIQMVNCRIRGFREMQLWIAAGPGSIELINCELDADFNPTYKDDCIWNAGTGTRMIARKTLFKTGPSGSLYFSMLGNNCTNEHWDCKFVGGGQIAPIRPSTVTADALPSWLVVKFCDMTEVAHSSAAYAPIRLDRLGLTFDIERVQFPTVTNRVQTFILNTTVSTRRQQRAPTGKIRFCKGGIVSRNAIRLLMADDVLIEYCSFLGTSSGTHRVIDLGDVDVTDYEFMLKDVIVRRVYAERNTGSGVTSSEIFLMQNPLNCRFLECWAVWTGGASGEDGFEMYNPQGDCEIGHVVVDNVRGEGVDVYQQGDKPGFSEWCHVHHVYGTCHREVVSVTGLRSGLIHDIYASSDFAQGSVVQGLPTADRSQVLVWSRFPDGAPENVAVLGPLPLPPSTGHVFSTFVVDGAEEIGDDVTGIWIEGDELVTVGDVDESRLVVK